MVGNASLYAATFSCTGNANAVTGNQVTISATDTSVICAYTNTYITPLAFTKTSAAYSDPVNGTANPKMIPGGFVDYTLTVTNPASYPVTSGSIFVIDPLPSQVAMFVNTVAPGPGPVVMTPNSSTLTYSFISLGSSGDDLSFSNNGGLSWIYTPTPDSEGVDQNITHIRINPKGSMATGTSFSIRFRVKVK